jgi:hypothetical protein
MEPVSERTDSVATPGITEGGLIVMNKEYGPALASTNMSGLPT